MHTSGAAFALQWPFSSFAALSLLLSSVAICFPFGSATQLNAVVLSTTEWIGGRNDFLGIAYLIVGSICILLALVFFVKSQCSPASDFGSVANGGASKESS